MHEEFRTEQFADSFVGVWKRVMTDPRGFFQDMPTRGGVQPPLLFLVGCLIISGLGFLIFGPRGFALMLVLEGAIRSFVYAAVFAVVARQLFGGSGDYEATYRVVGYGSAPAALLWIPLVGRLAMLYAIFLMIVGLERVHGFDAVKSVLTVLLSTIVLVALGWTLGLHHHGAMLGHMHP